MSTLAASYLAKARGSGEPEASSLRVKDLENFTRELRNTCLDRGNFTGKEYDTMVHVSALVHSSLITSRSHSYLP